MEVIDLIKHGESKTLEFKELLPKGNKLSRTVVAFSNTAGGKIIIGVDDKRNLIGISDDEDIFKIIDTVNSMIYDNCFPQINFNVYAETIENKTIIIIEIFLGREKPYYLKKEGINSGVYIRVGAMNRKAELQNIISMERERQNISFDEEIDKELNFKGLDLSILKKKFLEVGKELSEEKLINMKLIEKEGKNISISRGMGIILGKYENTEIKCARFKGTDSNYFLDKKEFNSNIFENIKNVEIFLKTHLNLRSEFNGMQRKDILEIPELALREALINAVVHRDYSNLGRDIKIAIYDHVVEITSPGGLPNTLTLDSLYTGRSEIRNRVLARVFKEIDFIEKWGTGLTRIKNLCLEAGLKIPEIREAGDFLSIKFYRLENNKKISSGKVAESSGKVAESSGKVAERNGISSEEKILEYIKKNEEITSQIVCELLGIKSAMARRILKNMMENNAIIRKGIGRNTYYTELKL